MSTAAELSQLRETLEQLQSFELPEKLLQSSSSSLDCEESEFGLSEEVLQRYRDAKREYRKRRLEQVFFESVATFDDNNNNGSFVAPEEPSEAQLQQVQRERQEAQQALLRTVADVSQHLSSVQTNYRSILSRRDELALMLRELEQQPASSSYDEENNNDDDDDDDVEDSELLYEEQKLEGLRERRAELEAELAKMQQETNRKLLNLEQLRRETEQLRSESPASVALADPVELKQETEEIQKRVDEFQEMADFFDKMNEIMSELCGMKMLSVQQHPDDVSSVVFQVQLLNEHMVEVALSPSCRHNKRSGPYRLKQARFVSSRTLTSETQTESGNVSTLRLVMPDLDDLVQYAVHLSPRQDLQFVLREAKARILTLTARVDELAKLRSVYLTQIGAISGGGGGDQELVCSLNEGITVVLRLTPNCPLMDRSVSLAQIVGVGGWDQDVLQQWKEELDVRNFRGPLQLMDALMELVQKHPRDGVPQTPSMPLRAGHHPNSSSNMMTEG